MAVQRIVKVAYGGLEHNLIAINNELSKSTIYSLFDVKKATLFCTIDDENVFLPSNDQNFAILNNIDEYSLTTAEGKNFITKIEKLLTVK